MYWLVSAVSHGVSADVVCWLVIWHGLWNRISTHCLSIWLGLLITWWLISKRNIPQSKSSKRPRRKLQVFYDPALEVNQCHFYYKAAWFSIHATQGHEYLETEVTVGKSCRLSYHIEYKATASNYFCLIVLIQLFKMVVDKYKMKKQVMDH